MANYVLTSIWRNLKEYLLIESMDEILDLGEPYPSCFANRFREILEYGATPLKLFKLNEAYYKAEASSPKTRETFYETVVKVYLNYGLSYQYIKDWMAENIVQPDMATA